METTQSKPSGGGGGGVVPVTTQIVKQYDQKVVELHFL